MIAPNTMQRIRILQKLAASFLSFALSYWILFLNPIINMDGILYLETAARFIDGDWSGAFELYHWPFYSLLIAGFSTITTLELEAAAYLITALSAAMTTFLFISIIDEVDTEHIVPFFISGYVIVFFSELNETRHMIMRDHCYWTFYLLSILLFIRCYKSGHIIYGMLWNVVMVIATLMRIEGIVLLVLLPFSLLFHNDWSVAVRLKRLLGCHWVNIGACLGMLGLRFSGIRTEFLSAGRLSDPFYFMEKFWTALTSGVPQNAAVIRENILSPGSPDVAIWIALVIPVVVIIVTFIEALTPVYTVLACYKPRLAFSRLLAEDRVVLAWVATLYLLICIVFVYVRHFMLDRYIMPLCLIALVGVTFSLSIVFREWKQKGGRRAGWGKWLYYALVIVLVVNSGEALVRMPGESGRYIKTAGVWLRDHAKPDERVFSNNIKVRFYIRQLRETDLPDYPDYERVTASRLVKWKEEDYDYFALWVDEDSVLSRTDIDRIMGHEPIKQFSNRGGDAVFIYEG